MNEQDRMDFLSAMGQEFGEALCPPLPEDEASPMECCEVIFKVYGEQVDPQKLSEITSDGISMLATHFGRYFETDAPSNEQVISAIQRTLLRWPTE